MYNWPENKEILINPRGDVITEVNWITARRGACMNGEEDNIETINTHGFNTCQNENIF